MPGKTNLLNEELTDEEASELNNSAIEDEEDLSLNSDNLIKEAIAKDENEEGNYKTRNVSYRKDKHIYQKGENAGLDYSKYSDVTDDEVLTNTSCFLRSMGLTKGLVYTYCKPSKFEESFLKILNQDYHHKADVYEESRKNGLMVSTTKKSSKPIQYGFDKATIIERAKEVRNKCFNLLMGNGKPEAANPEFVKLYTEVDKDGNQEAHLGYDYKKVDKLFSSFDDDEKLYKKAISNINCYNFAYCYKHLNYYYTKNEQGEDESHFDLSSKVNAARTAREYAKQYNDLKLIHKSRPWYYFITNPIQNIKEKICLGYIHDDILECAEHDGVRDEMEKAMNSSKEELQENLLTLENALKGDEKELSSEEEHINAKNTFHDKENVVIPEKEIEPVSDEMDEFHKHAVDGYAMREKTVYLSDAEFARKHQTSSENTPSMEK